jgi:hypothetical protein
MNHDMYDGDGIKIVLLLYSNEYYILYTIIQYITHHYTFHTNMHCPTQSLDKNDC